MNRFDYIITGCGLSGLMLAYRLAKDPFFDHKNILILESKKKNSDDRTWSFWEEGNGEWDHLVDTSWKKLKVNDVKIDIDIDINPYTYKTIKSSKFYDFIWNFLETKENFTVKFDEVLNISHRTEFASVLTKSSEYVGKKLFNSILFDKRYNQQLKFPVLQQHFVGWFIETEEDVFDSSTVNFMDFSVEQRKKTRFMYVLPFSKTKALVEYTLFSDKLLPEYEYDEELKLYLRQKGIKNYKIERVERGSIPMTSYRFWKQNSSNVLYIGTTGGWTKPSTGFTFKSSSKKTKLLVDFLKEETVLKKFKIKNRFWYYDLLFLDVLSKKNEMGSKVFLKLFKRNSIITILKFLDEESSFLQELKIILSLPPYHFFIAFIKRFSKFNTIRH